MLVAVIVPLPKCYACCNDRVGFTFPQYEACCNASTSLFKSVKLVAIIITIITIEDIKL